MESLAHTKFINRRKLHLWVQNEAYFQHGPLTRYAKLRVAHALGMPGTFSSAAEFKGNRELAIPAGITARAWRTCRDAFRDCSPAVAGKTFSAFLAHAHPQFYVFGKRPICLILLKGDHYIQKTNPSFIKEFVCIVDNKTSLILL